MNLLSEISIAIGCTLAGSVIGHLAGKADRRAGALLFVMMMGILVLVFLTRENRQIMFMPVLSFFTIGLAKWWSIAFAAPCVLFLLARWLRPSRLVMWVRFAAVLVSLRAGLLTAIAPWLSEHEISGLQTQIDAEGVCLQSTEYLCGPAAAVTALRKLGIQAGESELALLFRTSRLTATQDDVLADRLNEFYADRGITATHGWHDGLETLRGADVSIAVVKYSQDADHFVTILEITDTEVVIGDPLEGVRRQTHAEFIENWRHVAVCVDRRS